MRPANNYNTLYISQKAGQMRTPEATKDAILTQLKLSTQRSGTDKVKRAVTTTGVNDTSASAVIQRLLDKAKDLRKCEPGKPVMPESEVIHILETELEKQMLQEPINPLIGLR